MDTSDSDIQFDEKGRCNHCTDFEKLLQQPKYDKAEQDRLLQELIERIKAKGKGKNTIAWLELAVVWTVATRRICAISGDSGHSLCTWITAGIRTLR